MLNTIKNLSTFNGYYNEDGNLEKVLSYRHVDAFSSIFLREIKEPTVESLVGVGQSSFYGRNLTSALDIIDSKYIYSFYESKNICLDTYLSSSPNAVKIFASPFVNMPHLDALMDSSFPSMPYSEYKKFHKEFMTLVKTGSVHISSYYDDSTDYTYMVAKISKIVRILKKYKQYSI